MCVLPLLVDCVHLQGGNRFIAAALLKLIKNDFAWFLTICIDTQTSDSIYRANPIPPLTPNLKK